MDGSDKIYFEEELSFEQIATKLPENLTSDILIEHRDRLEKTLSAVTRKISELILSHQPAYVDELKRIADLKESINFSIRACARARGFLKFIKDGTAIVELHKKRESLSKLLRSLTTISESKALVLNIRASIESKDFPKALQLCEDGKILFKQYRCIPSSNELKACIIEEALNHFKAYHRSSKDELRMFLDEESWELVPVKKDFKLIQLKEFSFLRSESSNYEDIPDSDEELDRDFVEEEEPNKNIKISSGRVLTNSSLNVLRMFGRYIQMMRRLKPISYEILAGIYDLLDQYTIAAYKKFVPDIEIRAVIRSIRENLMGQGVPNLDSLSGYRIDPNKAVAIDSLIFLVNQLWNLQEYLESLIPAEMRPRLKEEFIKNPSIVPNFLKARAEIGSRGE